MPQPPAPAGPPEDPIDALGDVLDTAAASAHTGYSPGTTTSRRTRFPLHDLIRFSSKRRGIWLILAALGPGLIAANAGNDAGGVATYSSVGAQYGYSLLWMMLLITVSLAVVQEMAVRMGVATGKGFSDLVRENSSIQTTAFVLFALLIANGGTVISEFVGIRASIELLFPPGAQYVGVPLVGLLVWLVVVRGNYASVEKVFLLMTLVFFAYPISAFLARPNWAEAARQTVLPSFQLNQGYILLFVATVGTTITPYMQLYAQSAVVEKGVTPRDYGPQRVDAYVGSVFANVIAAFIIIATAATLFVHHKTVTTAADAAKALGPLAGKYAELIFSIGLFGASILAAAVLPLATAYSITEGLGLEKGLGRSFRQAPAFMGIFTGLIILGVLVTLIPGLPIIRALIIVQVVNGLLLPVVLFTIIRLVNNRDLMGDMVNGRVYNAIAWVTTVLITLLSLTLLVTTVLGWFGVNI